MSNRRPPIAPPAPPARYVGGSLPLILAMRDLAAAGRHFADGTLERIGLRRCRSCARMPWDCDCPMSVRDRNGWNHDDLNAAAGGTVHGRLPALPSVTHPGDAAAELRALVQLLEVEANHDADPTWSRAMRHALRHARGAASRAGVV